MYNYTTYNLVRINSPVYNCCRIWEKHHFFWWGVDGLREVSSGSQTDSGRQTLTLLAIVEKVTQTTVAVSWNKKKMWRLLPISMRNLRHPTKHGTRVSNQLENNKTWFPSWDFIIFSEFFPRESFWCLFAMFQVYDIDTIDFQHFGQDPSQIDLCVITTYQHIWHEMSNKKGCSHFSLKTCWYNPKPPSASLRFRSFDITKSSLFLPFNTIIHLDKQIFPWQPAKHLLLVQLEVHSKN